MTERKARGLPIVVGAVVAVFAIAGVLYEKRSREAGRQQAWRTGVPRPRQPDILLITIDTLRADAAGFAGNSRVETPTLDRLAGQGLVFSNAHAHNVVTLPSHANILTGLYPYQNGVRENGGFRLPSQIPTLATLLKAKGYATGAFVGAFPLDSRFGLNRGFDVYDDHYPKEGTVLEFDMPERPAADVIASARKWYEGVGGRPRFLWVHLYDCHAPYHPPAPFAERYKESPYLGEVAGVDAALGPLLTPFLEGQSPPTLIILTGDHGEALGDHEEETHSLFAYEATLKVPLILWFRNVIVPGADGRIARHVDIAPTIAEVAGIPKLPQWPGGSLLGPSPKAPNDAAYFEAFSAAYNYGWAPLRGVLADGLKFIDLPLPELYDLAADPSERRNLAAVRPDDVRRLRRLIPSESAIDAASRSKPDSESAARLRSLGYLSGNAQVRKTYTAGDDPKQLVGINREMYRYMELYERGDLPAATALARRVVQERPTMVLPYDHLAFLLRRQEESVAALEIYRLAVSRGIANEQLVAHYGLTLCEVGRADEAVKLLRPFSNSSESNTLKALGIALADSGHSSEAVALFERVLRLDPENVDAYENLGIVRLRSGELLAARDCFRRALAIDERNSRAWNGLGVTLARLGDDPGAIDSWARAVTVDPKMYDALFNLGLTAAQAGLRQQARDALERFISTAPRTRYGADVAKAQAVLRSLDAGG